jgi:hypothetical protein
MNNKIKLLLLSLGFAFISVQAHAQACDPCNSEDPPEECPPEPGPPGPPQGSMQVDVIVDGVVSAGAEPEIAAPATKIPTDSSVDSKPSAE